MKDTLAAGLNATREFPVDRGRTIDFMGEAVRVYATPMLLRDIETACRELLLPHLDAGEDSVGTKVELEHLAATPLGLTARIEARVTEVKGRAVTFEVVGSDGVDTICRAKHGRFVVDVAQAAQRLERKRAKAA